MTRPDNVILFNENPNIVSPEKPRDNNGGGGNMNNKNFVTHKEFDEAMGNIDKHFNNINLQFEKINTKLEKQKNDIVFAILTITGAGVGFLSLLIAIIALLKWNNHSKIIQLNKILSSLGFPDNWHEIEPLTQK